MIWLRALIRLSKVHESLIKSLPLIDIGRTRWSTMGLLSTHHNKVLVVLYNVFKYTSKAFMEALYPTMGNCSIVTTKLIHDVGFRLHRRA
jgi:hypothetical protein